MKCSCGVIWLTDSSFKRTLDQLYQRGVRNMSLSFVITSVAWPVVSYLFLFISVPYVFFITVLYQTGQFLCVLILCLLDLLIVYSMYNVYTTSGVLCKIFVVGGFKH